MLFNSFEFLFFFVVVTCLFFTISHKYRWPLLLTSSSLFYMAFIPKYILILGSTIVIDYLAGILIEKENKNGGKLSRFYLILSLITNIGVLAIFKYLNFLNENISWLLHQFGIDANLPLLKIILPIGLSFHTFQAMSYTIEVYRKKQTAEKNFGIYALYVMFYPQLVAGPIERPQNILHQFHQKQYFDYNRVTDGLRLMVWGLFKKVVIADRLATFTDPVFDNPEKQSAITLCIAAFFFSYQIFCDFSGYSDIALGSARVMGFKLMKNFDNPYQSKTISEFWSRWHISLSSWFRDYLYIPIGGNKVSVPRWYFNLFFVFMVSGLWHGASWTFIIWGALHGMYLIFGLITKNYRSSVNKFLRLSNYPALLSFTQVITTFLLVTIAWIFFRSQSVESAFTFIKGLSGIFSDVKTFLINGSYAITVHKISALEIILSGMLIAFLETIHYLQYRLPLTSIFKRQHIITRWAIYYLFFLIIVFLGVFEKRSFIYFQF
jgi:alginate O-acetyltransferase complex protein AlgI